MATEQRPTTSLGPNPDVTLPASPAPGSPTPSSEPPFAASLYDLDFDNISDRDEIVKKYRHYKTELAAVRTRAMAADFSEGRLETFVGSPLKELAGTQNQYVSYQVTTKVSTNDGSHVANAKLVY